MKEISNSNPVLSLEQGEHSSVPVAHQTKGSEKTVAGHTRRLFLQRVGGATVASMAVGAVGAAGIGAAVAVRGQDAISDASLSPVDQRIRKARRLRIDEANNDAAVPAAVNVDNGDEARYPDKGATHTKSLRHDAFGRVRAASYASFQTALHSGKFSDFEEILVGGTRKLNGPQGGLTFDLEGLDEVQFGQPQVPPAPKVASHFQGTELIEMYWASLLRDRAFTTYGSSPLAAQAAAELSAQADYQGPRNGSGVVTPRLLFRGRFQGEDKGPYVSQFFLRPAFFGAQPLDQKFQSYAPDVDYLTDFQKWLNIQNGVDNGERNDVDPIFRYRRNGRDLAAYTHVDVLYQAYFTALLVLGGINANPPGSFGGGGAPLNPGNPYVNSTTENGFDSFGGPDFAGTLGEIATRALHAVWYQKWMVHLRARPEEIGGRAHLIKTGQGDKTDITLANNFLNSQALQASFNKYGSYLLSQPFPEGSPSHPSYPTGHGTVGGACITLLKFFFDGDFVIPDPVMPSPDGLSLVPYTGPDADNLTVNGELNKLAGNVTFGHGTLAGIHWRSDSDTSLLLGEQVALEWLKDRALTYNEPFTVNITKLDGSTGIISNPGNP